MTQAIIITLCSLLLIAYAFDLTSAKTKIPSVILLLLLGWIIRQASDAAEISIPDLTPLLPVFGTIGLILIVLEGSLELELNREKATVIKKSFVVALVPMLIMALLLTCLFHYVEGSSLRNSIVNAIPLCVISSAIAIPSARNLAPAQREFVVYESSQSDIFGVLFFNFVALNDSIGLFSFGTFFLQLILIAVISFVATLGLTFLLNRIDHHIKFVPIILLVILIYAVSKIYHLPGLLFILLFGLFIGNLDELRQLKWISRLKPGKLDKEVHKFKDITIEATFIIRAVFFILFGYLIETAEIFNTGTLIWAIAITAVIFIIRAIQLKLSRIPLTPLLFIAPRGLITILLFLSIPAQYTMALVSRSLIIQVIILTALVMMSGLIAEKREANTTAP